MDLEEVDELLHDLTLEDEVEPHHVIEWLEEGKQVRW